MLPGAEADAADRTVPARRPRARYGVWVLWGLVVAVALAGPRLRDLLMPPEAQIVFVATHNDHPQLFTMRADGTQLTPVPTGTGAPSDPSVSPDGKQIAFAARDGNRRQVVVMGANGAHPRVIAQGRQPVFSPDGRSVVYVAPDAAPHPTEQLFLAGADGRLARPLTSTGGTEPVFTPRGQDVIFTAGRTPARRISIISINPKHSVPRDLTHGTADEHAPACSPDGRRIAYIANGQVWVMAADGTSPRALTHAKTAAAPRFSPDGTQIAFSTADGLYVMPADGGEAQRIGPPTNGRIAWTTTRRWRLSPSPRAAQIIGMPSGYFISRSVSADVDGDGQPETAYLAMPVKAPVGDAPAPKHAWVVKDGAVVWQADLPYYDVVDRLAAIDLTGDGTPELLLRGVMHGGSDDTLDIRCYRWTGKTLTGIIATPEGSLTHLLEGGLALLRHGPRQPVTLVRYDFIWADDESHADPHRFLVEWYTWHDGAFTLSQHRQTAKKYTEGDPLREFGITKNAVDPVRW